MFADHETILDISLPVACARLTALIHDGFFGGASRRAYAEGLTGLLRVGPFGPALGASKLVRVHLLEPFQRNEAVVLALRWEATGVAGRLFPVLDGDLVLTPVTQTSTRLALTGAYRPPLGGLGAGLDRLVLHRAATATIRALLGRIADELAAGPATAAEAGECPAAVAPGEHARPGGPERSNGSRPPAAARRADDARADADHGDDARADASHGHDARADAGHADEVPERLRRAGVGAG